VGRCGFAFVACDGKGFGCPLKGITLLLCRFDDMVHQRVIAICLITVFQIVQKCNHDISLQPRRADNKQATISYTKLTYPKYRFQASFVYVPSFHSGHLCTVPEEKTANTQSLPPTLRDTPLLEAQQQNWYLDAPTKVVCLSKLSSPLATSDLRRSTSIAALFQAPWGVPCTLTLPHHLNPY